MFFLTIIVLDYGYNNSPESHKKVLGVIVVILIFIILCLNLIFALFDLISRWTDCQKEKNRRINLGILPNPKRKIDYE